MVKQVAIGLYYKNNPLPGLCAVIRVLRAAEEWADVRQLVISTFSDESTDDHPLNVADYEDEIEKTSAALVATMPGIRHMPFEDVSSTPLVRRLGGQLAVLYSDQLERLLSFFPITVPPDHTFRQLKDVSISYDEEISYQHPRVDPANLVSLDFSFWSSSHSWVPFSADDGSMVIEFPNLTSLTAMYQPTNAVGAVGVLQRDDRPWKLHFPKLNILRIDCTQDRCPLLEYAVLPPRMDKISIKATALVLVRVAEMGLPVSRRLSISINSGANDNPAVLAAASRILKSAQGSKEIALEVDDRLLPVLPESITCTSLTELTIWSNTSVDAMLELIRKLPSLVKLDVQWLALGDIQEDISVPGPDESRLVEPLSAKIKEVQISAGPNEPAPEMLVTVAKYLLLKAPTLARLCSKRLPRGPIAEFVDAYSKRYPHLAGIEYDLADN